MARSAFHVRFFYAAANQRKKGYEDKSFFAHPC